LLKETSLVFNAARACLARAIEHYDAHQCSDLDGLCDDSHSHGGIP